MSEPATAEPQDVRVAVDITLAKIEDATADLRRLAPLSDVEKDRIAEVANWLADLGGAGR